MKEYIISTIFCIIIFILITLLIFFKCIERYEKYEEEIKFPFKFVYGDNGKKLNIIAITAPFRSKEDEERYEKFSKLGYSFLGVSSYINFPDNHIDNPYDDRYSENNNIDYFKLVKAWLHCFREPSQKMKESGLPLALITEADLRNVEQYKPDKSIKKEYDWLYVCLDDNDRCEAGWQSYNRNWELAKKCMSIFCQRGMKGAIIGRKNCSYTELCRDSVKVIPQLDFYSFLKELQKSRMLFVPNIYDASPRIITEAMCLDIPVIVNKNILGGWHNIKDGVNGEFFNDETDIERVLDKIVQNYNNYTPREWFVANRGYMNTGKELANFLIKNFPELRDKKIKFAYL